MTSLKQANAEMSEVRFVFDDDVVSLGFPTDATFKDVANSLDGLFPRHDDAPLAINVELAAQ
jgi:hypothetical protein